MHHRIPVMDSSRLLRRGAFGPALAGTVLAVAACAAASDLKLDLARPVPLQEYRAKLAALKRCEAGSMSIAYSFGDAELTVVPRANTCAIQVAVTGELAEGAQPRRFLCDLAVIEQIDWLEEAAATREHAPSQELLQRQTCVLQSD